MFEYQVIFTILVIKKYSMSEGRLVQCRLHNLLSLVADSDMANLGWRLLLPLRKKSVLFLILWHENQHFNLSPRQKT